MGHDRHVCAATASFGLESLVRDELAGLGITVTRTEDRRVIFEAGPQEIARANLCLRTADRVHLVVGGFDAPDFGALFDGVRALPWRGLLSPSPRLTVNARTQKSKLTAVPSLQSVTQKAIMEAMRGSRAAPAGRAGPGGGPAAAYDVELVLAGDHATLYLDTTGPGLHKRGYRRGTGPAPLRETLAAALVMLSRWTPGRPFADPLCGSGTIPIEAALIGTARAPGLGRSFASEGWDFLPAAAWAEERERARGAIRTGDAPLISGSDRDPSVVRLAQANARAAGVEEQVRFHAAALADFVPASDYGCLVCNPPYGERLGDPRAARALYVEMGALYRRLPTWSFFALTADQEFPRAFGARDSRNRKLYNGNIRCWLYQYFGPLPR